MESPPTWCDTMTPKQLLKAQLEDADLEMVIKWLGSGKKPHGYEVEARASEARHYWLTWDLLTLQEGFFTEGF